MSVRERSHWAWGYEDAFPDEAARAKLAARLEAAGLGALSPTKPVARDAITLPASRIVPPYELRAFGSDDPGARIGHAYGKGYRDIVRAFRGEFPSPPDWVFFPETEEQIASIFTYCEREDVAIVPFGGGTSVVGGVETVLEKGFRGVVTLSLAKMANVVPVSKTDRTACIQGGASGPAIEAALATHGLTLRHYPQSFELSTLGGWIATRSADGRTWPLETNCPIGRSPSNAIVLNDPKVSRRHAVVHRQDVDEFWLVDLGSGNGSYINGRRISLPARLAPNDAIGLGDTVLRFQRLPEVKSRIRSKAASMTLIEVKNVECWMLLADIVGSTKLAGEHEPEAWARLVGSWAAECRQIVELHGGTINKYLGDGFLAIWPSHLQPQEHVAAALESFVKLQAASSLPFGLITHVGGVAQGGGRLRNFFNTFTSSFEMGLKVEMPSAPTPVE